MVLFTISCDTCASRLNVKQQAAIGRVLACPKCGSMVHVTPPDDWDPSQIAESAPPRKPKPPRDPNDPQATQSAEFPGLDTSGKPLPPKPKAVARRAGLRTAASTPTATPGTEERAGPEISESVILPDDQWTSDSARQRGKALAWIAGLLGICLVALVFILYMVSSMFGGGPSNTDPETVAKKASAVDQPVEDTTAEEGNSKDGLVENQPATDEPEPDSDNADSSEGAEGSDGSESTPPQPENSGDESLSEDPAGVSADEPGLDAGTPTKENDDESPIDEEAALTPSSNDVVIDQGERDTSMLDEFGDAGDLVFNPGIDMDEFRSATTDDPTNLIGQGKVFVPQPRPLDTDYDEATSEVYLGLAYQDQSLIQFVRNFFRLTQIPVQLDGQAIAEGLIDPLAKVNAVVEDDTAMALLENALEPMELTWRWNEDKSVIIVTPERPEGLVTRKLDVDPQLLADDPQAEKLIASLKVITPPESWNSNGGEGAIQFQDGQLIVDQTDELGRQIESLLKRLSIAAQLKDRPEDPTLTEALATVYSRNEDFRNSEGTYQTRQAKPVQDVLNRLQEQDGMTIVMDWNELMPQRWNPDVTIPWPSKDSTLESTLRDLTLSMGLAYRMLDEGVFQVTSKQKHWNATRTEVYPCAEQLAKNYTPEQLIEFLKKGIAADLPSDVFTRVEFVHEYACLVAVLPDPLHIRVEKILNQLAGD